MAELIYAKKRLEPIITKFNIDVTNDKVFHAIIELFNNQTDYQMWALKLVYGKVCPLAVVKTFKQWADANPTEISLLSKQNLVSYKTATDIRILNGEIQSIDAMRIVKSMISRFNTTQRNLLKDCFIDHVKPYNCLSVPSFSAFYKDAAAFEKLPAHRQQKFISLMSAVTRANDICNHLHKSLEETYDWVREDMLAYAERNCPDTEVIYDKDNVVIMRIPSFESSRKLCGGGRTSWCLTRDSGYFQRYTKENNNAQQFFLFDFNREEKHDLAHVGFSVNPQRGINYAHSTRNNNLMGSVRVGNETWDIKRVLNHYNIPKNVYVRLKKLVNYKWDKGEFLAMLASRHINVIELADGRLIIPLTNSSVMEFLLNHTLMSYSINNNAQAFAVFDFSQNVNDEKSVMVFIFNKDRYETMSFSASMDAYGAKNTEFSCLAANGLKEDYFIKQAEINPNILLHKYIDQQNYNEAIKLLSENKDVDPCNIFYKSTPLIKAISVMNEDLFNAIINHPKFDFDTTKLAIAEPYAQFLFLFNESKLSGTSKADKECVKTCINMCLSLLRNPKYNINEVNINNDTILHLACEHEAYLPIVEYLLSRKDVRLDLKNDWEQTPLASAIDARCTPNMKAIKLLLADPRVVIDEDVIKFANDEFQLDIVGLQKAVLAEKNGEKKTVVNDNEYEDVFSRVFNS